ncbi:rhomboid family intramembrane serine protease [Bacteroides fragilis]|nr:rhomboid family intramembrane serine protease [Bacteroides fragilis]
MRPEIRQILLTMVLPLFLIFILYMIKVLEIGMDWDFTSLGVYPLSKKGMFGIFTHPLIHSGFKHLLTNSPQKPDPFANEQEEESVSATDETDNIETDKEEEHEIDAE